jgi:hypothetical protein
MVVAMGENLLREAKLAVMQNVLFCIKNVGLAKEPDHNWLLSFEKNDIAYRLNATMKDRCRREGEELS